MIRVGMANPNHVIEFLDQLIIAYKHPKVFKFLHVPVQSGNDEILKSMHRRYTVKEFKEIISRFRKEIPEITIATDIICGFPGETKEQFMDSVNLMSEIKPDVMNISRFWPRPGTDAAEMKKQLTGGETKERSTHIRSIFEWLSLEKNKKWLKWEGEIIIDEKGNKPENKDTFFGRNYCYKPVAVEGNFRFGDKLKVKIASSGIYHLSGIPLALQKFKYG
jgi:threonylcarbamoyladenosine tRNA methylthiotransferase CDKAL1